jgi:hypothetical protein
LSEVLTSFYKNVAALNEMKSPLAHSKSIFGKLEISRSLSDVEKGCIDSDIYRSETNFKVDDASADLNKTVIEPSNVSKDGMPCLRKEEQKGEILSSDKEDKNVPDESSLSSDASILSSVESNMEAKGQNAVSSNSWNCQSLPKMASVGRSASSTENINSFVFEGKNCVDGVLAAPNMKSEKMFDRTLGKTTLCGEHEASSTVSSKSQSTDSLSIVKSTLL